MSDFLSLSKLTERFARRAFNAAYKAVDVGDIKDPGPDKYNFDSEEEKRKLMAEMAFYAESGPTFDPDGEYLCSSCLYRMVMDWDTLNACYIVSGETKMDVGTCMFYRRGTPDSESNPLPMGIKYSQAEAGYSERPKAKGFGCYPRCGHASVAEGQDKDGRPTWCGQFGVHVQPKACCYFEGGSDLVTFDK